MNDDVFLEEAVKKYKGFLHLTRKNRNSFCVPTIDIDLIWHSHQLSPASYSKDMIVLLGTLLGHDDTDPDRTESGKVAVGFSSTTSLWEETFGIRYAKATTMNRDSVPSPLSIVVVTED